MVDEAEECGVSGAVTVQIQMRALADSEVEEVCSRFIGWPLHPLTELVLADQLTELLMSKCDFVTLIQQDSVATDAPFDPTSSSACLPIGRVRQHHAL